MTIPKLPWTRRKRDGLLVRIYAGGRPAAVELVMPEGRYRWRIEGNGDDVTVEGYAATEDDAMEAADAIGALTLTVSQGNGEEGVDVVAA